MTDVNSVLMGAVAMASLVATIFFARFWKQTGDALFIYFAVAFGLDAVTRFILGMSEISEETQPLFYVARLVTFGIIIFAIVNKNIRKNR
jgi:xanthine/uracil permease